MAATQGSGPAPQVPAPPRPGVAAPAAPPPAAPGAQAVYPPASERYAGGPAGAAAGSGAAYVDRLPGGYEASYEEQYEGRSLVGLHIPGASTLYAALGLLQLAAGLACIIAPYALTAIFFRNMHLPHRHEDIDLLFEELWRILGASLLAGSITCYALKVAADRHLLAEAGVQRLQHGLLWFALLAVVLHIIHLAFLKTLTLWGLLAGALAMGPTLLLPSVHLGLSGGFAFKAKALATCCLNMFAPRRFSLSIFLFALLTILFTLAGLAYLVLPQRTLQWTFGSHKGHPTAFLWQWIGAGMLFLFPAVTYTLHERALVGHLFQIIPKVLNVGLLVASLFHILEFGSLLVDGGVQSRWMLPALFAHWLLVLVAAIVGLSVSARSAAPALDYEPLVAA